MPWYPSAKACPAAIKPTVQCFFPTLYQVLLFDFSSFGEKLFFCLRGYAAQSREARCKNSRSAERCARRRVSEANRRQAALRPEMGALTPPRRNLALLPRTLQMICRGRCSHRPAVHYPICSPQAFAAYPALQADNEHRPLQTVCNVCSDKQGFSTAG